MFSFYIVLLDDVISISNAESAISYMQAQYTIRNSKFAYGCCTSKFFIEATNIVSAALLTPNGIEKKQERVKVCE